MRFGGYFVATTPPHTHVNYRSLEVLPRSPLGLIVRDQLRHQYLIDF